MVYVVALLGLSSLFVVLFALCFAVWAFTMSADIPEEAYVQISD
ncbi:hypothetical protein BH24DEI2_BH24DEI2_00930 [soil metagenome]